MKKYLKELDKIINKTCVCSKCNKTFKLTEFIDHLTEKHETTDAEINNNNHLLQLESLEGGIK